MFLTIHMTASPAQTCKGRNTIYKWNKTIFPTYPIISAGPFCRQFSAIFRSKVEEEEAAVEALW